MHPIDSGEEERRLQDQYAHMTDDELQVVADDSYDLTEIARRALQSEISQRGLDIKLKDAPEPAAAPEAVDEANGLEEDSALIEVRYASDLAEARKLQQILDAAGIPYCWGPDNLESIDRFPASFSEGLALKVCRWDQSRAIRALDLASPEPDAPEEPDSVAVCPKCHAPDIVFQGRDPEPATADSKFKWSCDACGHQWEDDGIEHEAPLNN